MRRHSIKCSKLREITTVFAWNAVSSSVLFIFAVFFSTFAWEWILLFRWKAEAAQQFLYIQKNNNSIVVRNNFFSVYLCRLFVHCFAVGCFSIHAMPSDRAYVLEQHMQRTNKCRLLFTSYSSTFPWFVYIISCFLLKAYPFIGFCSYFDRSFLMTFDCSCNK